MNITFLKADVVIYVNNLSSRHVYEHVIQVSVPKANYVPDHRHDCGGPGIQLRKDAGSKGSMSADSLRHGPDALKLTSP